MRVRGIFWRYSNYPIVILNSEEYHSDYTVLQCFTKHEKLSFHQEAVFVPVAWALFLGMKSNQSQSLCLLVQKEKESFKINQCISLSLEAIYCISVDKSI